MLNFSLKKSLVAMSVTNQDYEGEITGAGDTVHITRPAAVTVGSYTVRTNITVQEPTETQLDLLIDQQDYFAIDVEDIEQVQANVALIPAYLEEANFSLADDADQYVFGLYTEADADNVVAKATLTASTIWDAIVEAKRRLSLNNVPHNGRFMVLSPYEIELLEKSDEFQRASDLGDEVARNGFMGRAAGFSIFESNNLTEAADGSDTVRHCVFGHTIATTFANQIASVERQRRELRFSDLVKGLHVYGAKVVKAKAWGDLRSITA
ncbi:MAG TPA: P22 phage major capsid protein family protein [Kiloniellaceae bacterium]|nr:P22 phage major capsid protein family protein [Kiloniellaceae bacterium]